ncbi:coronin-7-like [Tubulanus polymorphus]|uniref:coronin-7-like n=1 Tax=Tubulanus polymorphus TaxID=672921 RepID=UPI003DA699C9
MWKFKVSKFKNTAPKLPKKEEIIGNVPVGNLMNSCGNHIKASCKYIAFNVESGGGGCLGILPLETTGKLTKSPPLIQAHTEFVSDFDFSPFDDNLLATASQDGGVKIWQIPDEIDENVYNAIVTFPNQERRVENVLWHPTASDILATSCYQHLKIYDVNAQEPKYAISGHEDQIQSISWKGDGSLIATTARDKMVRVFDPRAFAVSAEGPGHDNVKDSRIMWLGDTPYILSTGFGRNRSRQIHIYDQRALSAPVKVMELDSNTGTLMPLRDEDTNLVFLAGKGDTRISLYEASEKDPYLTEFNSDMVDQVKGVAMVPKLALNVMQCEVARLMVLTKNSIIPLPYQVPRKTHTEFYGELFPDTNVRKAAMTAEQWINGENALLEKVSLDPSKQNGTSSYKCVASATAKSAAKAIEISKADNQSHAAANNSTTIKATIYENKASAQPPTEAEQMLEVIKNKPSRSSPTSSPAEHRPTPKTIFTSNLHQAKFRHFQGTAAHKSLHIDNIRNLSNSVPGESDGFAVNSQRCAVSLTGAGGIIAVFEVGKPCRLPDSGIPIIQNGRNVSDFVFDPFDDSRLVVGCDDARIQVWTIPDDGLTETLEAPDFYLTGHNEKIYFVRFHPLAKDILASASYDMTVKIWDLGTRSVLITLEGHTDTIFCLSWSPDGSKCATVCKDGKIRIYEPRTSTQPILGGAGPDGTRGARIVWVCNGKYLAITGFDKKGNRLIAVYDASDLTSQLFSNELDYSPSIIIPHYDEDSSTIFLTGRGDSAVYAFEAYTEYPHLFPLSTYKADSLHQAIGFLPKLRCDVKNVEFAKGFRLTASSIEPISFTVPRVKMEYFQDDIFPDTNDTTKPTMTADEWMNGASRVFEKISLRPSDMKPLSEAPVSAPKPKKYKSYKEEEFKTDEQKKEELLSAMVSKMEVQDSPLPQDLTEGVDSDEWSD